MKKEEKTVFYLTYFDLLDKEFHRNVSPAGISKSIYIYKTIESLGNEVQIISPAEPLIKGNYPSENKYIEDNIKLKLFKSFYSKKKVLKIFRRVKTRIALFFYLLFKIPKNSTIIVYHSLSLMKVTKLLKKIKKINFILEMNELYGDVINNSRIKSKEIRYSSIANAYIFPTEVLAKLINNKNKPEAINYGNYKIKEQYNKKFDDKRIHLVYSGTLSAGKGAEQAVKTGLHLDDRYHIHILGFGNEDEKKSILVLIDEVKEMTNCEISFDGLLQGDDYDQFLQKCEIGLCTQSTDSLFNDTSFPSKILSYLSNGLKVVSVNIAPVYQSRLKEYICFYEGNETSSIANAIKRAIKKEMKLENQIEMLVKLEAEFKESLRRIL